MPIETIEYKGKKYPKYLTDGNSLRFMRGFVDEICKADKDKGEFGYNIGSGEDYRWNYPLDAIPIDLVFDNGYHALNLPKEGASYIVAAHLIEHLPYYVDAIEYWYKMLKVGGTILIFAPHPDQEYWLPQNNRKHLHTLYPKDLAKTVEDLGFKNVFYSERDLYWGFTVIGEK